jgi:NAD+ synthase (glutamine-hydrolysing)
VAVDLRPATGPSPEAPLAPERSIEEELYEALKLALRDYVSKNGFEKVVVGVSGGIDSSLTATIAVDALGGDSVLAVAMPSEFSSLHSLGDAKELCSNLGIEMLEIGITSTFHTYIRSLKETFGEGEHGIAEENLQARVRGNILMAISNRYGHLVVTTGNKSETAVGYSTLYGDTAGGFALLKDVLKTEVYALARYRNSRGEAIPENVLSKPPSAELRPNQRDEDSLMPYENLDPILEAYIEHSKDIPEIVAEGHDEDAVRRVVMLVDRAEYKRRQAPPGPKVTVKAFGKDRRLPITNRWRHDASLPIRDESSR